MGFRFWRRVKIAPGITLNFSKSGASVSLGPRGSKFTIGPRGKRFTMGLPGTGMFYTTKLSSQKTKNKRRKTSRKRITSTPPLEERLTLGFLKRIVTPDDEKALVDGCREWLLKNEEKALQHFVRASHLADGALLAGFLSLKYGFKANAEGYFLTAINQHTHLGRYFSKYGISAGISIPITEEISAEVGLDIRGALLGLVEVYQLEKQWKDAVVTLEKLQQIEAEDIVVKLSFVELLLDAYPNNKKICQKVVKLIGAIENETPIHTALFLYKGMALRCLGMLIAARETLTIASRRKKARPIELLRAIHYERALVYEDLGQKTRMRAELEKIYADAPDYEDVAKRLGI